jgi:hypothetical protein
MQGMSGGICSDVYCDCTGGGCTLPQRRRAQLLSSRPAAAAPGPGARWVAAKLAAQEAARAASGIKAPGAGGANAGATVAGGTALAGASADAGGANTAAAKTSAANARDGTTARRPALAALALPTNGDCRCSFGGVYPNCDGCSDPNMSSILQDSGGTMSPGFAAGVTVYTVSVANGVASVKLSALFFFF